MRENNNTLKNLFNEKKYDDVIDMLKVLYSGLYVEMLDFKKERVEEKYSNMSYSTLSALIPKYYPTFSNSLNMLDYTCSSPDMTYLEVIDAYLSTYLSLKENYKKEANNSDNILDNVDIETMDEDDEEESFYENIYEEIHKDE